MCVRVNDLPGCACVMCPRLNKHVLPLCNGHAWLMSYKDDYVIRYGKPFACMCV